MKKIKLCPFCGSDCTIDTMGNDDYGTVDVYRVRCNNELYMHSLDWWEDTIDKAIEVWNMRIKRCYGCENGTYDDNNQDCHFCASVIRKFRP